MENSQQNETEGLSSGHLHELEGVLSSLLTNQEMIIEQNKELLSAKKNEQIWKVIKVVVFILIVVVPMFFLPQIMESMMELINGIMGEQMSGITEQAINEVTSRELELKKLLGQ